MFCSSGGSSARPASSRTPVTAMNTRLVAKLRSVNIARSNSGCLAVTMWTTNIHPAPIARPGLDDRFPAREPVVLLAAVEAELQRAERDREQREAEHVELALVRLGLGHEPRHHQHAQDADRQVDQEHPAPVVIVGQPAAEHRPEDRADHHAAAEQRHRLAVLLARVDVEQRRLGERNDERAADALERAEQRPSRQATSRSRTAPKRR